MSSLADTIELSDPKALAIKPLVSVYMATYRQDKYIAQAIEGVIGQQCNFPVELIIGEDCSPDNTRAIVIDYQHKYPHLIRVLTAEKNIGAKANASRCLSVTRGEYIAFCEGDDYWHHQNKLQIQVDAMQADRNITLCHTDFDRLIGKSIYKSVYSMRPPKYPANGNAYYNLLHQWSVITATSIYRADIIQRFLKGDFNRLDWPFGDYNKALFASTQGTVMYLPISTATWRKVPGSAGNKGLKNNVRLAIAGVECREAFLREYPLPPDKMKEVLCYSYNNLMKDAFIVGDRQLYQQCRNKLEQQGCQINMIKIVAQSVIIISKIPHLLFHAVYAIYNRTFRTTIADR